MEALVPGQQHILQPNAVAQGPGGLYHIVSSAPLESSNLPDSGFATLTGAEQGVFTTVPFVRSLVATAVSVSVPKLNGVPSLYKATRVLTDAEIKALPTTSIALVPATEFVAANFTRLFIPLSVANVNSFAVAYANQHATLTLGLTWGPKAGEWLPTSRLDNSFMLNGIGYSTLSFITDDATWDFAGFFIGSDTNPGMSDNSLNIGADNGGAGDFTDGDAANTMKITVTYMVWNISTGKFE